MSKPTIRFEGFTDDWGQCKLGDVSDIVGGGTPSTNNSEYWDGEIDWYAPAEIGNQIYINSSKRKITKMGLEKSSAKMLPVGTVLFTSRAGIGNTAILNKEACTNQGFQSIVPHKDALDSYFIYSRTEELKRYGETKGAGSTFVEVSGKQMSEMNIMIPNIKEQRAIGNFFQSLDSAITLYQRKCDELAECKKYFLKKMFPAEGEKVPEIRFDGFTEDWKQCKFGEIAYRVSTSCADKSLPQVEYEDVNAGQGTLNKNLTEKNTLKSGIAFQPGDVLFGKLRPYLKNWLLPDFKGIAVGDWWVLRSNNVEPKFIYDIIQTDTFMMAANLSSGSKMPRSDWNLVSETDFAVPHDIEEQRYIGEFFETMNATITLHQRKLEELKEFKKFMLQNMFV